MLRAYRLFTGAGNASHVEEGLVEAGATMNALQVSFAESPPHAVLDWHVAPVRQFVITLSGTLEFTTRNGATFTLGPGDVLLAEDTAGTGHEWRLIDDRPWRRAYVILAANGPAGFTRSTNRLEPPLLRTAQTFCSP